MDAGGFEVAGQDRIAAEPPRLAVVEARSATVEIAAPGLRLSRLADCEALVVTKTVPGFTPAAVEACKALVEDAAAGRLGPMKFLVFDFAHPAGGSAASDEAFAGLASDVANLVLRAPIVSVACARAYMSGADLELALGCSMVIAERGAKFDFDADPVASLGIYASLSRKIGFVRAERLMEEGRLLEADEMKDLLLIKDAADAGEGPRFLEAYLKRNVRRHNSCYSIYRAQRIVSPPMFDRSRMGLRA